ncbi:MAG TPA: TetR/AcrR family transcriptional regulator [Spirochaetota bacterium]|nr:TetR/AcrR family transcriptional regulator [Spirochaetota bacterium]HQP49804.1 TetR/AcrR family transcriptional regulator [Spirochaetota bacterium]
MQRNPAIEKRLQREKERRIQEILQAAQRVMLIKNYSGATMEDIAAEAGITKPTIYQYFKTKDELFVSMVSPLIEYLATRLESIRMSVEKGGYNSGKDIIHDVFNVYYETFEQDQDMFRLFNIFLQVEATREMNKKAAAIIKEWGIKCFQEGNQIVHTAIEEGLFKKVDVFHTTDFAWGAFWGIVQVEQNKWGKKGISRYLKPVLQYTEDLLVKALVEK